MKSHEEGDGPAVLVMLLLGAIVVVPALIVEARYEPPFWVHALLWPVPIFGLGIWMLRVMKGHIDRYAIPPSPRRFRCLIA